MTQDSIGITDEGIDRLADIAITLQRCFMLRMSLELSRGKVSFAQFFLLGHIGAHEALTMTEIAGKMNHTTAAATGLVDRLESLGYVHRIHARTDRRKVLVSITKNGAGLVEKIRQDMAENLKIVMKELSADEQLTWLRIYEKIIEFCKSQPDACIR